MFAEVNGRRETSPMGGTINHTAASALPVSKKSSHQLHLVVVKLNVHPAGSSSHLDGAK